MAKSFGLDIGATSLSVMQVRQEANAFFLDSVATAPLTSKGILSESIVDQQILADSIKKLVSDSKVNATEVTIALPQSQVYAKIIEMPQLSEKELTAALLWEMEQYIPLPLDQVRTDWQILDMWEKDGRKMMNVFIVAVPLSVIEKYEKIISLTDFTLRNVETEVIAVHRALLPLVHNPHANLIIHLGSSTTDIIITKNGVINMIFSIGLGGLAITRAISVDLGIDIHQAEDYKRAYGLSEDVFNGKIGKSLSPILQSIVGDIKKGILLFKERNSNENIKQVVLSGGNALLPGLDVFLANTLNIEVMLGNGLKLHQLSGIPDPINADFPSYNVVLGLALREYL